MSKKVVELVNIKKSFLENDQSISILDGLYLDVQEGEKIAVIGPSGSGKSTLIALIAGLDPPTDGQVLVNGKSVGQMSERDLSAYRNQDIGIIFQSFELILPFTVYENVCAPQEIKRERHPGRVDELLAAVGLTAKSHSSVTYLSGGEKQRVAIARALANDPALILADEPTGSLDRITGRHILQMLIDLVQERRKTLVIITHDEEVAKRMDKVYLIQDKKLVIQ